jgi:hypothetical protein
MAHFAKIDENNIVTDVIVVEPDVIATGLFGDPINWIQTSYNTRAGIHINGGIPLRKNYASIGFTYDPVRDAFIPPQDFPSWTLNEESCTWESPVPYPTDGRMYRWHEESLSWIDISQGQSTPVEEI